MVGISFVPAGAELFRDALLSRRKFRVDQRPVDACGCPLDTRLTRMVETPERPGRSKGPGPYRRGGQDATAFPALVLRRREQLKRPCGIPGLYSQGEPQERGVLCIGHDDSPDGAFVGRFDPRCTGSSRRSASGDDDLEVADLYSGGSGAEPVLVGFPPVAIVVS